ncbi:MAG: hypothetical protein M1570_18585 [Chloroflexi bacterium]|nr:hypothetical protein [Chloroflexota bacterium]
MARLTVPLDAEENKALWRLATAEKRDPRAQAALIIRQELERRGLLSKVEEGNHEAAKQPGN